MGGTSRNQNASSRCLKPLRDKHPSNRSPPITVALRYPSSSILVGPQDSNPSRGGLLAQFCPDWPPLTGRILHMAIATTNPATGEVLKTFEPLTATQIEQKLQLAASAFQHHRRTSFADRAAKMMRAAEILEKEKDECARLMTLEMGKPLKAAVAEAQKCATGCRYYAENAERFLADEIVETGAKRSFIRYLPIGPILAIMPWNFPFWQVFRFAAPALMAGNVGLSEARLECSAMCSKD